jgi:hypothetical protein
MNHPDVGLDIRRLIILYINRDRRKCSWNDVLTAAWKIPFRPVLNRSGYDHRLWCRFHQPHPQTGVSVMVPERYSRTVEGEIRMFVRLKPEQLVASSAWETCFYAFTG